MPAIRLLLDGDGAFSDLQGKEDSVIYLVEMFTVATLTKGMTSGRPSLAIRIDLPDGRVVIQATSLGAWIMTTAALRGKFPEVFRQAGL